MNKIIKFNGSPTFTTRKNAKNRLYEINDALAEALNLKTKTNQIKRRALRAYIIDKFSSVDNSIFISHKDIKRLENPGRFEIPLSMIKILKLILSIIKQNKDFEYRADRSNTQIIIRYILDITIQHIENLYWHIKTRTDYSPEIIKYKDDICKLINEINEFNEENPGIFNNLFD